MLDRDFEEVVAVLDHVETDAGVDFDAELAHLRGLAPDPWPRGRAAADDPAGRSVLALLESSRR